MRGVSVYIEGVKLDLFDDEQINVTSIQQNVQDISKVFTDFSQSFTVPATPNNNQVFEHFYQNDVNATIDFNVRREALIEIDLTTFRRGKISLEKTEVKNNEPYSYQITFYGDVASLKDTFGESKLVDISTLSSTDMSYTFAQVSQRITDDATEYPIRFPLIVGRNLTYGDGASTDISHSGSGSILYNELFPALAVYQIFNALQTQYGITFNGGFLNNERFRRAFLYCQNAETFTFNTKPLLMDIASAESLTTNNNTSLNATDFFSLANDTLTISELIPSVAFPTVTSAGGTYFNTEHIINLSLNNLTAGVDAFIDVYENDQLIQTYDVSNSSSLSIVRNNDNLNTSRIFKFLIRSTAPMTGQFVITYRQKTLYTYGVAQLETLENQFIGSGSISTTATLSVLNYLPDMKIVDFFKGILQMFNLTCYGTAKDVYQIEPLDDWYQKGAIVDITEYTDIKSTKIDRVKLFKNISFKYQESECATNEAFRDITGGRDYGNTSQLYDYDGGEYKIDLPFENMILICK